MTELGHLLYQLNTGEVDHLDELHLHTEPKYAILNDILDHPRAKIQRIHVYKNSENLLRFVLNSCSLLLNWRTKMYWIIHGYSQKEMNELRSWMITYGCWTFVVPFMIGIDIYGIFDNMSFYSDLVQYIHQYTLEPNKVAIRFYYGCSLGPIYQMLTETILPDPRQRLRLLLVPTIQDFYNPYGDRYPYKPNWMTLTRAIRRSNIQMDQVSVWLNQPTNTKTEFDPTRTRWHPVFIILLWAQWRKLGNAKELPMTDLIWRVGTTLGWPMDLLC